MGGMDGLFLGPLGLLPVPRWWHSPCPAPLCSPVPRPGMDETPSSVSLSTVFLVKSSVCLQWCLQARVAQSRAQEQGWCQVDSL